MSEYEDISVEYMAETENAVLVDYQGVEIWIPTTMDVEISFLLFVLLSFR